MDSPDDSLRYEVVERLSNLPSADERDDDANGTAAELLDRIASELESTVASSDQIERLAGVASRDPADPRSVSDEEMADAEDLFAVVHEWAGLASYVTASVYGPSSPMPRRLAGWSRDAVAQLERVAKLLQHPLQTLARVLRAVTWTISVGFPWGISIGLSWG